MRKTGGLFPDKQAQPLHVVTVGTCRSSTLTENAGRLIKVSAD